MKNYPYVDMNTERRQRCECGKVSFDKKSAQTKKNWLERHGNARYLRIYPCPKSDVWHLTHTEPFT